jgi:hypothetical protein
MMNASFSRCTGATNHEVFLNLDSSLDILEELPQRHEPFSLQVWQFGGSICKDWAAGTRAELCPSDCDAKQFPWYALWRSPKFDEQLDLAITLVVVKVKEGGASQIVGPL